MLSCQRGEPIGVDYLDIPKRQRSNGPFVDHRRNTAKWQAETNGEITCGPASDQVQQYDPPLHVAELPGQNRNLGGKGNHIFPNGSPQDGIAWMQPLGRITQTLTCIAAGQAHNRV